MYRKIYGILKKIVGVIFILIGVVLGFVPILQGWVFVLLGLLLLGVKKSTIRRWLRKIKIKLGMKARRSR